MKLVGLLQLAGRGYQDGLDGYFDPQSGEEIPDRHDDTLALFVVRELRDTFDPKATEHEQLREAQRVMLLAAAELRRIADEF